MSYREVDFNVVMDACYHWLKEFEKFENQFIDDTYSKKWSNYIFNRVETNLYMNKCVDKVRVEKLLTLAKSPGSLNRIVHLSADDAKLLFGDL